MGGLIKLGQSITDVKIRVKEKFRMVTFKISLVVFANVENKTGALNKNSRAK
jgi:hypothetical protein